MTAGRRHNRVQDSVLWAAVGAAVIGHLIILALIQGFGGIGLVGEGFSVVGSAEAANLKPAQDKDEIDLQTSCSGDVLLATTARAAMCLAPWNADAPGCSDGIAMQYYMDLSGCMAQSSPIATVAMVDQKTQLPPEKLKPIDAEQLVEEFQQQQQKPPPPPPMPQPQPQNQPPPPPPPPQQAKQRPQQVVETVKPNDEKEPDNARLLSEYNVKVEKEKVNRGARNEPMVAKAQPEELQPKKDPSKEPPSIKETPPDMAPGKNEKAPETPGKLSMRRPGVQTPAEKAQEATTKGTQNGAKNPLVSDGFVPRAGTGQIDQERREAGEIKQGENGAGGGTPPMPNLKPSKDQLERALGGGSVDHLDDVDNGDETALSAKRWVYASFFNRLKRQVAQNWDPQTVWRRSDPNGTHYGTKTRVTEVRVTLGAKGELQKIVVTGPSGSNELDEEAVRSFHAASPFPNPPEGLANKDGQIIFAFSFYFEIGQSHTSWRVIRQ